MSINDNLSKDIYFHYVNNKSNDDLYIFSFGHEKCHKNKEALGPMEKYHFFVHFILNGNGVYKFNNRTHYLGKNDIFVYFPNHEFYYKQDFDNPWEYIWIEFSGLKAKDYLSKSLFSVEDPIYFCMNEEIRNNFISMLDFPDNEVSLELNSLSHLYKMFALLINERNPKITSVSSKRDIHINLAIKYIENNYANCDLSLIMISRNLHINPSYLSRIFKEIIGTPISKYIIDYRMSKASELLEKKTYPIKDVAYMVGYSDPHFFSNEFKKHHGISPTKFEAEGIYVEKIEQNEGM